MSPYQNTPDGRTLGNLLAGKLSTMPGGRSDFAEVVSGIKRKLETKARPYFLSSQPLPDKWAFLPD